MQVALQRTKADGSSPLEHLKGARPMAKYGKSSQKEVKSAMHEYKQGKLKSGKSNKTVKNRKQAIAIGLSKARKKGAKVPARSKS
jgi:hypothetical protein